jgi:NAD(P)H-quinone oxidoreductase subunit I
MFGFLKTVGDYTREAVDAAKSLTQGLGVTFDHLRRRPITVQYPYEKLIPSERYRGRIHYEFDKCIACEVCVRVCPINLPVVDWVMNKATKKKELRNYSIDFGVCIFCGNCVEYCPTNCLSMTEEYRTIRLRSPQPQFRQRRLGPAAHQRHHGSCGGCPARTGLPAGRCHGSP